MNVSDFRTLVLSVSPVAAIISARMYPVQAPQEVFDSPSIKPCIVYSVSSAARTRTFCATEALHQTSVDVDCYATDYDTCNTLANAVIAGVIDFGGTVGSTTFSQVDVSTELDLFDPEPGLFRRTVSLLVWSN